MELKGDRMSKRREKPVQPAGDKQTFKQAVLETGAKLLQDLTPMKQFDVYVVGFHCAKLEPDTQMEAHHYCQQVNEDFLQCVILDGNTENANLIGIEYIISERLFEGLPEEEKGYWHPHNFEVLSGQLVAPGLPDAAEKALMKMLVNSYGKTWHTWHTGRYDGQGKPADPLPYGDPMLMWSFNHDGEADESLHLNRNQAMDIDELKKRRERQDFVSLAHPQRGVDLLKDAFTGSSEPPPGVRDVQATGDDETEEQ
jgi:hypothetical protein